MYKVCDDDRGRTLKQFKDRLISKSTTVNQSGQSIDHFAVVCSVTWSLNGGEARCDLVLIQTSLLLLCKSSCSKMQIRCIYMSNAERSVSKQGHL